MGILLKQQAQVQQQIKRIGKMSAGLFNQKNQIQTAMLNKEMINLTSGVGGLLEEVGENMDDAVESIEKVQNAQKNNDELCNLLGQADGLEEFEVDDLDEQLKALALEDD